MKKHFICALAMIGLSCTLQAQNKFDVNDDGVVNVTDIVGVYNYILTGESGETPTEKTFKVNGVSFTMKKVEAGTFNMGGTLEQQNPETDEIPVHTVTLTKDYYMGETEVTQELWLAVTGFGSTWTDKFGRGLNYPAYNITYDQVQTFIANLNELTGQKFRMPTEAEWEFAARGGNKSKKYQYSGSNTIDDVAWYFDNSDMTTHPVKTKQPNELGLYDMTGNVSEWCLDWYGSYESSPATNPTGPGKGSKRVCRGGNWNFGSAYCRNASRLYYISTYVNSFMGFRLALTPSQE